MSCCRWEQIQHSGRSAEWHCEKLQLYESGDLQYKDPSGKVKAIYDADLKELRKKEDKVLKEIDDGIDYAAGEINVIELVEKYVALKEGGKV